MGRLVSHLVCIRGCSVLVDVEKIEVSFLLRIPPSFLARLMEDGTDEKEAMLGLRLRLEGHGSKGCLG